VHGALASILPVSPKGSTGLFESGELDFIVVEKYTHFGDYLPSDSFTFAAYTSQPEFRESHLQGLASVEAGGTNDDDD
jgi:hypothetical protein